ncbi:DNA gyrase/topoisomerase [Paraglaciecola Antarctic GD virus 1]|nr:DNA gyrase/topoisomerase [Paraglaciecola Antarctic GD virus 1]
MDNTRTVTNIIDNEALEYAMYTIQSRAIASLVDGFKPVHRYVMTMALKTAKNDFVKVAALGGSVSQIGYNHGEVSAQDACKLLASDWSNNVPFLQGRGNFGSRLVNDSAASRYVYAKVHENFNKLYKDFDILPENPDPEQKIPLWYLPTVPTILLNGVDGIATGFATKIMPYDLKDIKRCCAQILAGKELTELVPSFSEFTGLVTRDKRVVYLSGIHKLTGYVLKVTEVPIGYDREKYVQMLDTLEESGKIISYLDECDSKGFNFTIKLKRNLKWTESMIVKTFKLQTRFTENITTLDEHGKLKIFDCAEDLVRYFVEFKLKFLQKRIDNAIDRAKQSILLATNRIHWIEQNLLGKIDYSKSTKKEVEAIIKSEYGAIYVANLISMNLYHMSTDEIDKLRGALVELETEWEYWTHQTPKMQFISDLK